MQLWVILGVHQIENARSEINAITTVSFSFRHVKKPRKTAGPGAHISLGIFLWVPSEFWFFKSGESSSTNFLSDGIFRFKMKVGISIEDDRRRAKLIRDQIGMENKLVSLIVSLQTETNFANLNLSKLFTFPLPPISKVYFADDGLQPKLGRFWSNRMDAPSGRIQTHLDRGTNLSRWYSWSCRNREGAKQPANQYSFVAQGNLTFLPRHLSFQRLFELHCPRLWTRWALE